MRLKIGMVLMSAAFIVAGCGKDRDHKPLPKLEVMSKSLIDTDKEYLYVPSTGQVSRTTSIGRPYFQGQERIVKLAFEEHNLVAYAVDKETQFADNETNRKIVFKIPIEHIEYREKEDAFGEGINVEERNDFVHWAQRSKFKAKPEQFKFTSIELLPTEFGKIFGGRSNCTSDQGQNDLEFSVSKKGIDIVIKRDYTSSIFCESSIDELFDLTWSEETHYSLVPLEDLVSKDYKRTTYERKWERTFGFFDHKDKRLDSTNSDTQAQEEHLIHRWDPNREKITYHLDPRFNKPENRVLKQATLKGVERLNDALKEAGAKIRIDTVDGDENFRPGNIKYSSIVLVEDPVGAGLLGYGPSVANPKTGEIVQARTVMYPGIMKKLIKRAYDELIEISERPEPESSEAGEASEVASSEEAAKVLSEALEERLKHASHNHWNSPESELSHISSGVHGGDLNSSDLAVGSKSFTAKSFFKRTLLSVEALFHSLTSEGTEESLDHINPIEVLSRHNMYPAKLETFTDITDKVLKDKILALGEKKPWDALTEETRKTIVDLVMPYVWIPTFIHEVGHNLGLRHNFQGSEDKDNFYTKEELAAKGIESELGSPYSSMMEYSKSEITGLRVPGKYDIAALRYGYADNVEMPDGSVVKASSVEPAAIKEYGYCSDEGVSLNPNCNRFDEGTNLVEIVDSMIDSYHKRYKSSYFRNGRANFSKFDNVYAAARVNSIFRAMRLAFERTTDIMKDFGIEYSQVKDIPWLKEMDDASIKAADFFMEVIAEPDYSCVLFNNGRFHSIMPFKKLQGLTFSMESKTCGEITGLNGGFQVVGELGRSILDVKYRDNPNIYLDQIDVRGVWTHKVLAMKYLTARTLNSVSFDDHTLSYLDHPTVGTKVDKFIKDLMAGEVVAQTKIKFVDGVTQDFEYPHSLSTEDYAIPRSIYGIVNRYLNLPQAKIGLDEALLLRAKSEQSKGEISSNAVAFRNSLTAYTSLNDLEDELDNYASHTIDGVNFFAIEGKNEVPYKIISRLKLIDEVYSQKTRQELIGIYRAISVPGGDVVSEGDDDALKAIKKGGVSTLLGYLNGSLPTTEQSYKMLLRM